MLIIEGLDKCGKTTLVNYLVKNLDNAFTIKNGYRPDSNNMEEREKILEIYEDLLRLYVENFQDKILIMDRYFISELVYGFKRGYNAMGTPGMKKFIREIEKRKDVLLIFCSTEINNIKDKFIEDKEEYVNLKEIDKLDKKYKEIISKLNINRITYNWTITKPMDVCNYVKNYRRKIENDI